MEATTNSTRTLKIDGMTGDACVKKVTDALKGVAGVVTQSVSVGSATITCEQGACDAACAAIKNAGYTLQASGSEGKDACCSSQKSQTEFKGSGQSCSPAQKSLGDSTIEASPGASKGADRPVVNTPAKPALTTH
ncbi:MAG: cation transporter [Planctomycetota bacterium]